MTNNPRYQKSVQLAKEQAESRKLGSAIRRACWVLDAGYSPEILVCKTRGKPHGGV